MGSAGEYEPPRRRRSPDDGPWTAERVAALRAELALTQAEFAEELGVRQQTVSEWETGRYRPRGASARVLQLLEERGVYDAAGGEAGEE